MADTLTRTVVPGKTILTYNVGKELEAGKHLALGEYNPQVAWLDDVVPADKKWGVDVRIIVYETDA